MKTGVIGSGDAGQVPASGFVRHGRDVTIGTHGAAKLGSWVQANPRGRVAGFADAAPAIEPLCILWRPPDARATGGRTLSSCWSEPRGDAGSVHQWQTGARLPSLPGARAR